MKKLILAGTVLFLLTTSSNAQFYVGAGYGTFRSGNYLKGTAPKFTILYSQEFLEQTTLFAGTAFYNKKAIPLREETIYDNSGSLIGDADKSADIKKTHYQIGFMRNLGKSDNAPVPNFFLGGGLAWSSVTATHYYSIDGKQVASEKTKKSIFGFNFNMGVHSQIKKLVIELKGNFDFMLGQDIPEFDDESLPRVTSTTISFYYPLTK